MSVRRGLRTEDFDCLALASQKGPSELYRALEEISGDVIGHRLFTIMRFDAHRAEVERVHSNMPMVYPVGGRKRKKDTAWSDHVLGAMKVFRATDAAAIRAAFVDHDVIIGLGLGSILNIPVIANGRCIGTVNLLHEAGWYRLEDEATGFRLAAFLIPALLPGRSI